MPDPPIFDGHNDAITREDAADLAGGRAGGHIDLPRMRAGGLRGGIFAIFSAHAEGYDMTRRPRADGALAVKPAPPLDHASAAADATAAAGRLLALERAGALRIARTAADLDAPAADAGSAPVAVMSLEGAEAIDAGLEALDLWHAAGLRALGPVWSRENAFAHGVPFVFPSSPDIGPGLTPAGVALVRRCAQLGILIDLSHLNAAGFWDVARMDLGRPLVASHSGVHAIAPASRNLTDAQLDAIAASDGLVGIVFACKFLRPDFADDANTPLSLIVDHARYVRDRLGIAHVALGSDFDGARVPTALHDVAGLPRLLEAFRAGGFTEEELHAVCWTNWRRVLGAWWDGAA